MISWRPFIFWFGLIAIIATFGVQLWHKQAVIDHGTRVLLPLRPADPRSLIQGDYMRLAFAPSVFPSLAMQQVMPPNGTLILKLDERGIGHYLRLDEGQPLTQNEVRLHYRVADQILGRPRVLLGPRSYLFPQGTADLFQDARYAIIHVGGDGDAVLIGLADEETHKINPKATRRLQNGE